ncbi:MAG TPA: hypothetical protein VFU05_19635 [Cyclobacteriaceae bacterium]|nr:hypothetical protein [Cyclobacteriaceae bacterium]
MEEDYLFNKYLEALERDRAKNQEVIRMAFEVRDYVIKLIKTGRLTKREASAILGITPKTLTRKIKTNNLIFDECIDLIDAYVRKKEGKAGDVVSNKNVKRKKQ